MCGDSTTGVILVYLNPISRSRVARMAWSLFRHPVKSREFPARHERLVTADELVRMGF
ncbi:MAG: hypothetical protein U0S13_02290 [Mycobacterium sp.]|jgi:hypothetical protein